MKGWRGNVWRGHFDFLVFMVRGKGRVGIGSVVLGIVRLGEGLLDHG